MNQWFHGLRMIRLSTGLLYLVLAAYGRADDVPATTQTLHGSVWFEERQPPPADGAELLVVLEDVSLMDVAARTIAAKRQRVVGAPPYAFSLEYDPAVLDARGRYSVRVRIEREGRLQFISTSIVDPFAGPAGSPVRVLVTQVGGAGEQ